MAKQQRYNKAGYILVSTIWVLAFMAIAAAGIGEWYGRSLALVGDRVHGTEARVAGLSTRATLLYKMATADLGSNGVFLADNPDAGKVRSGRSWIRDGRPDVVFDGSAYRGYGDTRFAVQDESGLYGLVAQSQGRTEALLVQQGIDFREAQVLAARLADYVDPDDLVRINGAESTDYRFKGLPPPRNRRLESPHELKAVMGWAEHEALWRDNAFADTISLAWAGNPNVATAPPAVLQRMRGASPGLVRDLVRQRHGNNEIDTDVNAWVGDLVANNEFGSSARPSMSLRLRFWREGERQLREYSVKFTPGNRAPGPWIIENNYRKPLPKGYLSETAKSTQLPDFVL